jgi:GntR family transcriptional regulator
MIVLASSRGLPLHQQIQRILRTKITTGEWDDSDRLPTELALMERFRVSRTTIRQALHALRADGLIVRRPRHGTFVTRDRTAQRARPVITNSVMGYEAEIRLVERDEVKPPRPVALFLGLPTDAPVVRFLRAEAIGSVPLCVVVNYLPIEIGRRISVAVLRRHSMLGLLQHRLGIRLGPAEQSLEARLPDDRVAGLLEIPLSEPVLASRLLVFDTRRRPVQIVDAFYRSDRTSYRVALPRVLLSREGWRDASRPGGRTRGGPTMPHLEIRAPMTR